MTQDRYQAEVMDELKMQDDSQVDKCPYGMWRCDMQHQCAHPPEWQGLSEDEIRKLGWMDYMYEDEQIELVREIEAKLKEKNT